MSENHKVPNMDVTFAHRIAKYIGRDIVIEDQFPVPVGVQDGTGLPVTVFSPVRGKLVEVYSDGFAVLVGDYKEPREFVTKNVRSVMPIPLGQGLVLPQDIIKKPSA